MSQTPSPEETARYILSIFVNCQMRPEEPLPMHSLTTQFVHPPWQGDDLAEGLDYAVEHHWIETTPEGRPMLTQTGFEQAWKA